MQDRFRLVAERSFRKEFDRTLFPTLPLRRRCQEPLPRGRNFFSLFAYFTFSRGKTTLESFPENLDLPDLSSFRLGKL